jgi:hypothetical protein
MKQLLKKEPRGFRPRTAPENQAKTTLGAFSQRGYEDAGKSPEPWRVTSLLKGSFEEGTQTSTPHPKEPNLFVRFLTVPVKFFCTQQKSPFSLMPTHSCTDIVTLIMEDQKSKAPP